MTNEAPAGALSTVKNRRRFSCLGVGSGLIVILVLLFVLRSRSQNTEARDMIRETEIANFQVSIDNYYKASHLLPKDFAEFRSEEQKYEPILGSDSVGLFQAYDNQIASGDYFPIEYTFVNDHSYRFCADFEKKFDGSSDQGLIYNHTHVMHMSTFHHSAGHACIDFVFVAGQQQSQVIPRP